MRLRVFHHPAIQVPDLMRQPCTSGWWLRETRSQNSRRNYPLLAFYVLCEEAAQHRVILRGHI